MTPTWLPAGGEVFLDDRGPHRTLRLSWHHEDGLVVLSLWRGGLCTGTFRLEIDEVPALIDVLKRGLDDSYRKVYTESARPSASSVESA
ncbi:MAG TPA: hypothetical protein VFK41_01550 [Nocardioidaceae bacterium]|nr:hypothetical protein [Nocardioidaceae bacterium]